MKESRYAVVLLIFASAKISLLLGEEAQPTNRTKEDHVTLNTSLTTGVPNDSPLAVNSSTSETEEDSNVATAPPPTQAINGSAATAQDVSPDCIGSLFDLRQAYFNSKTAPGHGSQDNTIFSFYPTDAVKYTTLAMFYSVSTVEDEDQVESFSPNPSGCCNPHNTSTCKVLLRYRSYLYRAIYPPLIYLFAFPPSPFLMSKMNKSINRKMSKFGVRKLCWKVPPFCHPSKMVDRQSDYVILKEFTAQVNATHTYACTLLPAHTHTHKHRNKHTCKHTHTHTHTHANTHTNTHTRTLCTYNCILQLCMSHVFIWVYSFICLYVTIQLSNYNIAHSCSVVYT